MFREEFEKKWHEIKGKLHGKWNKLSNEDIERIGGKYDNFLNKLQKKYNFTREQAEHEIQQWQGEGKSKEFTQPWTQGHKKENEHFKKRKAG